MHGVIGGLLQMIHHLALRMKAFHALEYVHRDLKPDNVMWLPWKNRWTVIDFGCAVRTGESAPLAFSLGYTAPKVMAFCRRGDHTTIAQAPLPLAAESDTLFGVPESY